MKMIDIFAMFATSQNDKNNAKVIIINTFSCSIRYFICIHHKDFVILNNFQKRLNYLTL